MFTQQNTDGYSDDQLNALNNELEIRLAGIDDPDERIQIEHNFSDEVSRR